jgi:hypothetical protein
MVTKYDNSLKGISGTMNSKWVNDRSTITELVKEEIVGKETEKKKFQESRYLMFQIYKFRSWLSGRSCCTLFILTILLNIMLPSNTPGSRGRVEG